VRERRVVELELCCVSEPACLWHPDIHYREILATETDISCERKYDEEICMNSRSIRDGEDERCRMHKLMTRSYEKWQAQADNYYLVTFKFVLDY
jgi:hypothetical protein